MAEITDPLGVGFADIQKQTFEFLYRIKNQESIADAILS